MLITNSVVQPLNSGGIGKVVASNNSSFKYGDLVSGMLEWANYTVVPEGKGLTKIDNSAGLPLSYYLGVLGEQSHAVQYVECFCCSSICTGNLQAA